ncbi:MAG: hypothetical protein WCE21_04915 [Candidatus Babeliales bacterium]
MTRLQHFISCVGSGYIGMMFINAFKYIYAHPEARTTLGVPLIVVIGALMYYDSKNHPMTSRKI